MSFSEKPQKSQTLIDVFCGNMERTFKDQLDRKIRLDGRPSRIISLVPSQTELLYSLGLGSEVVGITKFCVRPSGWTRIKTIIGGTKQVDIEKVRSLKPDIIIANKEENDYEQVAILAKEFPVWISDIRNLDDAVEMIGNLAEITGTQTAADEILEKISQNFPENRVISKTKTCAYLIWWNPMMTVNQDTFIDDMLRRSGLENVFAERSDSRYPEITEAELIAAAPEILLLSSEPFPFNEKHIAHFQKFLPNTRIEMADGEMFSWYGSRLIAFDKERFA